MGAGYAGESEFDGQLSSTSHEGEAGLLLMAKEAPRTRKVSVQLSEQIFERLAAATDRPGLGKSMVHEANARSQRFRQAV
jgi:hypothetical protein